jgi:hypothetical protein
VRTATTVGNEEKLRAGLYDENRLHTHAVTPFLTNNSEWKKLLMVKLLVNWIGSPRFDSSGNWLDPRTAASL